MRILEAGSSVSSKFVMLLAILILVSCQWPGRLAPPAVGVSGASSQATLPAAPGQISIAGSENAVETAPLGFLRLIVRWPDRDRPGFRAATIPTSTGALVVWVWAGLPSSGVAVHEPVVVARPTGVATTSIEIPIRAGRNLSVVVKAFREANPDLGTAGAIAQGSAAGVNIAAGHTSAINIVLDALFVPAVTGFDTNFGVPGQAVTIAGSNLDVASGSVISVSFNGTAASAVTPLSRTSLQVVVPSGATSGNVAITNDGIKSTSTTIFWVLSSFDLGAARAAWDPSPTGKRIVLVGQTLPFYGIPTSFAAKAGDDLSALGASPSATMSVAASLDNPAAGSISGGTFTAASSVAAASLSATFGQLAGTSPLAVSVESVAAFTLSPATGALGPFGDASIPFLALNTLSGGATVSLADFTSSDPASVSVQGGVATPADDTDSGFVTIMARCLLDPGKTATAGIVLTRAAEAITIASGFWQPGGLAGDRAGNVYVVDRWGALFKVSPGGSVTTLAASGVGGSVAVDWAGNVYCGGYNWVTKLSPEGKVTAFATGVSGKGVAVDGTGNAYVAAGGSSGALLKVTPGGSVTTLASDLDYAVGVAIDKAGNLYVAESSNLGGYGRVRKVSSDGNITNVSTSVWGLSGVAVDEAGNVYMAKSDYGFFVTKVTRGGVLTIASGLGNRGGIAVDSSGAVYVADDDSSAAVRKVGELTQTGHHSGSINVEIK